MSQPLKHSLQNDLAKVSGRETSNASISLHFQGSANNPLVAVSALAPISWDLSLTIDTSGNVPVYTLNGQHTCYPAFEMYIDQTQIISSMPTDNDFATISLCLFGFGKITYNVPATPLPSSP